MQELEPTAAADLIRGHRLNLIRRGADGSLVMSTDGWHAVGMAEGPARGLEELDLLAGDPTLAEYPHLAAARGTFLGDLGQHDHARAEFERAAAQTGNVSERRLFLRQAMAADERDLPSDV